MTQKMILDTLMGISLICLTWALCRLGKAMAAQDEYRIAEQEAGENNREIEEERRHVRQ